MKRCTLLVVFAALAVMPQRALSCNIPVFRYALEKWDLTPYDVLVYHRGPLPAEMQAMLKPWTEISKRANIEVTIVNLDEPVAPEHRRLWEQYAKYERTPWMLVRSQSKYAPDAPAWSGPFTEANFKTVLDSPMRQATLAHLTRGSSVVYLFLTSGDAKADRNAFTMARKELPTLAKKIKLEQQAEEGPNKLQWAIPLKVDFPLLVLDRTDPAEAAFVKFLLGTENGLDEVDGPILFAIFGRGRVLSLHGKYLTDENLVLATSFLCAKCSCDKKEELGAIVDLLMLADWPEIQTLLGDGKDAVAMPTSIPTTLPYPEMIDAPAKWVPQTPDASTQAVVNRVAPSITETTIESRPEKSGCHICGMLWIAIGGAGVLVLGTGVWAAVVMLRK